MDSRRTNASTKVAPRSLLRIHGLIAILATFFVFLSVLGRLHVSAYARSQPRALLGRGSGGVAQARLVLCALPAVARCSAIAESGERGEVGHSLGGETLYDDDIGEEIEDIGDLMDIVAKEQQVVVDPDVVRRNDIILSAIGKKSVLEVQHHLLVSLADGTLVALHEKTGEQIWSIDTGAPLVASSTSSAGTSGAASDGTGQSTGVQGKAHEGIFPGTDGSLYTYRIDEDGSPNVQKLPVTVKDLVQSSPSPTPEGSMMLGSQQSVVFIIDLLRGIVLKTIKGTDSDVYMYLKKPEVGGFADVSSSGEELPTIVISRKDFILRSIHPSLGEQWNVTWSQMDRMPFLEVHGHGSDDEEKKLRLLVAPDYSLKCFDELGKELWSSQFDSPPITAYPARGKPIDVLSATKKLLQSAVDITNSRNALARKDDAIQVTETLVVGENNGGLFGMRAPHFKSISLETTDAKSNDVNAPAEPESEDDSTSSQSDRDGHESKALMPVGGVQNSQKICKDPTSGYCRVPVGFFSYIEDVEDTRLLYLPKCSSEDMEACPEDVEETETETPFLIFKINSLRFYMGVILVIAIAGTSFAWIHAANRSARGGEILQGGQGQEDFGSEASPLKSESKLVRLEDGRFRVGRLEVGTVILGYGSGGTIVYEGILDGRKVAVKRILKQFVDLAKQEIEALIDSDEHPNVVRCFAMEEDGEFVYLALERCDMTLADAIESSSGNSVQFTTLDISGNIVPTPSAFQIARDIAEGVCAVHSHGIVHRDLKPHNVLLNSQGRAKLSDMGLSKRVVDNQASFETVGAGGSPGWQAPEQLILRGGGSARQTAAVDVFSSGLLIHYSLTGGKHPYGENFARDGAILKGQKSLDDVAVIPCASDILISMLADSPDDRPCISEVLEHPLWWTAHQRLGFIIDISDRVEVEDRAEDDTIFIALEALSGVAIGGDGEWVGKLDDSLVENLGKYRKYDSKSLRDLLRVIRNKHNHFRELPDVLQKKLGIIPEGFLNYFETKFPSLVTSCFYFALKWYGHDPIFEKYYSISKAEGLLLSSAPLIIRDSELAALEIEKARIRIQEQRQIMQNMINEQKQQMMSNLASSWDGTPVRGIDGRVQTSPMLPRRPWMTACDFYVKTGTCKFGMDCKFDHPPEYQVELNPLGLPIRPGQPRCSHFERTGTCKYGAPCKYDHSIPSPDPRINLF